MRRLICCLFVLGLAACATPRQSTAPASTAKPAPTPTAPAADASAESKEASDAANAASNETGGAATDATAKDVAKAATPTALPKDQPPAAERLPGQTAAAVESLLGPAEFKRREKRAQMWRYRAKNCTLFLFLYPRGSSGNDYRIGHVEAVVAKQPPGDAANQACLNRLWLKRSKATG